MRFEPNVGQSDARVRFLSRAPGYGLFRGNEEWVMALRSAGADGAPALLRLRLVGANKRPEAVTASAPERDSLRDGGWAYERDEGFLYETQQPGTVEVFRLYNRNSGTHLFTENPTTKDAMLQQFPGIWVQHSSLGYAYNTP